MPWECSLHTDEAKQLRGASAARGRGGHTISFKFCSKFEISLMKTLFHIFFAFSQSVQKLKPFYFRYDTLYILSQNRKKQYLTNMKT